LPDFFMFKFINKIKNRKNGLFFCLK